MGAVCYGSEACSEGAVRLLLEAEATVDAADNDGQIALMLAAGRTYVGSEGAVRLLLEAGAKVDETNNAGETALIKAAERDDENAVRMLLKAGAAVDAADNDGQTHRTNVRCS